MTSASGKTKHAHRMNATFTKLITIVMLNQNVSGNKKALSVRLIPALFITREINAGLKTNANGQDILALQISVMKTQAQQLVVQIHPVSGTITNALLLALH